MRVPSRDALTATPRRDAPRASSNGVKSCAAVSYTRKSAFWPVAFGVSVYPATRSSVADSQAMLSTATTSGVFAVACLPAPLAASNSHSSLRLKVPATHASQSPSGE